MEHFSVVIVGAGISGLSAAPLEAQCPNTSFTILEGRPRIGGTWDLFKYPGIRSDSDMCTLGFDFKPWSNAKSIAEAHYSRLSERNYRGAPALAPYPTPTKGDERVWSSNDAQWVLTVVDEGQARQVSCQFLLWGAAITVTRSLHTRHSRS